MKHTPGPWSYPGTGTLVGGPDHYRVADVSTSERDAVTMQANARLIAAAPEMLQALKDVKAHLDWVAEETQRKWSMRDQRVYEAVAAALIEAEI